MIGDSGSPRSLILKIFERMLGVFRSDSGDD